MPRTIHVLSLAALAAPAALAAAAGQPVPPPVVAEGPPVLDLTAEIQFRYYGTFADTPDTDGLGHDVDNEDFASGFQLNRTRLKAQGDIPNSPLSFTIMGGFSRSTGNFGLEDAYVNVELSEDNTLRLGQFKLPFSREFILSPMKQQAIERSIAHGIFTTNRSQGLLLEHQGDRLRLTGALSDGTDADNTTYVSAAEYDFGLTARADVRFGEASWAEWSDFASFRGDETGFLLGGTVHWDHGGDTYATGAGETSQENVLRFSAEAGVEGGGWNAQASLYGQHIDAPEGDDYTDLALVLLGGFFVSEQVELYSRYELIMPDDNRPDDDDPFHAVVLGATYYIIPESHALKVSAEVLWVPSDVSDYSSLVSVPNTQNGLIPSDGDQVSLILQFQMVF